MNSADIEGGYAASNPKDMEFFAEMRASRWHAQVAGLGGTRRANVSAAEIPGTIKLLNRMPVAAIFGKAWQLYVRDVLRTTPAENLAMVRDTVSHLKANGCRVISDAEHFFDGYRDSPDAALAVLKAAAAGGASVLVPATPAADCSPLDVYEITRLVVRSFLLPIGIHCHNIAKWQWQICSKPSAPGALCRRHY